MKKIAQFPFLLLLPLLSCNCRSDKDSNLKIVDKYVDTSFGMAQYLVYAPDTNWAKMRDFSDSLNKLYNGKTFDIVMFCYPEHSIPVFKKDVPFAIRSISNEPNFTIAAYYDTSHIHSPVLVKFSSEYIQAKKHEKDNPRETK